MTTILENTDTLTDRQVSQPDMGPVVRAAFVGTAIEFYDFFVFATATNLVFGKLFFPTLGGARSTFVLASTFAVAVLVRPLGGVLFGHLGDRLGRRATLIATMTLMGVSTAAVGLLPTHAQIGNLAPALLISLRCLQGLAVGGEWSSAAVLLAEHAPHARRARYGGSLQLAPMAGFVLSAATFLAVLAVTGDPRTSSAFQNWGWRIPFLASVCLLVVGLYVRLRVEESPLFVAALRRGRPTRVPVTAALREQWQRILLCSGALAAPFGFVWIATVFVLGYAGGNPRSVPPGVLGFSESTVLAAVLIAAIGYAIACPAAATAADRWGRRGVLLTGNLVAIPTALLAFPVLHAGGRVGLVAGLAMLLGCVGLAVGPAAAFVPELFALRHRHTATGLAYNLASVVGALLVVLAPRIVDAHGTGGVGIVLAVLAVVSLTCLLALPETAGTDLAAH